MKIWYTKILANQLIFLLIPTIRRDFSPDFFSPDLFSWSNNVMCFSGDYLLCEYVSKILPRNPIDVLLTWIATVKLSNSLHCCMILSAQQQLWALQYVQSDIWVFPKIGVGPPNHPILIGFSIINHPFWGTTIFGNTHFIGKNTTDLITKVQEGMGSQLSFSNAKTL